MKMLLLLNGPLLALGGVQGLVGMMNNTMVKAFPPTEQPHPLAHLKIGDIVGVAETGEPLKLLGFTGHQKHVFEQSRIGYTKEGYLVSALNKKDLYYADIETAQEYALQAKDGAVGAVCGVKIPEKRHHAPQRFEGPYDPLSPQGQDECGVRILHIVSHTKKEASTRGVLPQNAWERAQQHAQKHGLVRTASLVFESHHDYRPYFEQQEGNKRGRFWFSLHP